MSRDEVINDLKMSLRMWGRTPQKESYEMAIRSLEAWEKVKQGITEKMERIIPRDKEYPDGMYAGLLVALEVVEKYKKEIEES